MAKNVDVRLTLDLRSYEAACLAARKAGPALARRLRRGAWKRRLLRWFR